MTASDRTKQLLAEGIKEMSAEMPFRKIRVGALCQRSGIDRRTFYYHFRDIYDLAAWIFNQTVDVCLPDERGHFPYRAMVQVLRQLEHDAGFYRSALAEDSQNALGRHIMDHIVELYEKAYLKQRGAPATEKEAFAIRYHSVGSLTMLRRWLIADCMMPPEKMAMMLICAMPGMLTVLFDLEGMPEKGENDAG